MNSGVRGALKEVRYACMSVLPRIKPAQPCLELSQVRFALVAKQLRDSVERIGWMESLGSLSGWRRPGSAGEAQLLPPLVLS